VLRKDIIRVIEKHYRFGSNSGDFELADSFKLVLDRTSISEFDKIGNITRKSIEDFYYENGDSEVLVSKEVLLYSDDNRLLQHLSYNFDSKLNHIEEYSYNEKNCLSEIIILNSDFFIQEITRYIYKDGKRVESQYFDITGKGVHKNAIDWNEIGKIDDDRSYPFNGFLERKTLYKYDSNGNKIECLKFDNKGNFTSVEIHEYDSCGNRIKTTGINSEGDRLFIHTCEFDKDGEKVTETEQTEYMKYTYSWKVNKFDERGNWTEKSAYSNGKLIGIIHQEIEYY
jgi:hypothetical protein